VVGGRHRRRRRADAVVVGEAFPGRAARQPHHAFIGRAAPPAGLSPPDDPFQVRGGAACRCASACT
jgi:hypothetical protein